MKMRLYMEVLWMKLLQEYEYVREFGEGVDRIYREMAEAGLPEPVYKTVAFMVHATIRNKKYLKNENINTQEILEKLSIEEQIIMILAENPRITRKEIASKMGITADVVKYRLDKLRAVGRIRHEGSTKAGKWVVKK